MVVLRPAVYQDGLLGLAGQGVSNTVEGDGVVLGHLALLLQAEDVVSVAFQGACDAGL
jgi:hypothetical protein